MTAEITKQQLIEYIEDKIKDLDEYHDKIKQKLLSIDLKSFDTKDQELEMYLNNYKAEGYALMKTKLDFIDVYQRLTKTDFMSVLKKTHPDSSKKD
jgi:hypothetical protein